MREVEDFMNRLHQQASGGDEARIKQDKAIMRIFGSWIEKRTKEYETWLKDGGTDAEYLGAKSKKACIDYSTAREMAARILGRWYDKGTIDNIKIPEFDTAYDAADEEEWWRNKYFANVS